MITLMLKGFLLVLRTHRSLVLEILALRHQLGVLQRSAPRPRLRHRDRLFWILLCRMWSGWADAVSLVKPETVIIHGELQKLGLAISQAAVSKYMVRQRRPPSQTWRTFLDNHLRRLVSVDFFTVSTVTFKVLFVFVVLAHDRRRVVHFNVTDSPTPHWTAQQIVEAFPWETAPRHLLRDRDGLYGVEFSSRTHSMRIREVTTAPQSPWQNPYVERLIGTLRRECLDHVVVLNETHLRCLLRDYLTYYHRVRTHLSLETDSPEPRSVERPDQGRIVETPMLGGLHHRYRRLAA